MTTKKKLKIALAFVALAGATGGVAHANDRKGDGPRADRGMRFERIDADSSGDVSLEEFSAAINARIGSADANGDGKMTVEEIASEIERIRATRMAERMIERFDADGDGALTMAEIADRQQKRFAVLDRNNDGKIVKDEMPRRGKGGKDREGADKAE